MDDAGYVLSMGVTGGLVALAVALAAATLIGVLMRRRAGRFRARSRPGAAQPDRAGALTEADLGSRLGEQATLVQFSTAFCAQCPPTRQLLGRVAAMADGVRHIEIDAASRVDLVRRLRIASTPTVLLLGPDGGIVSRAVGLPRQADVIAALGSVVAPEVPGPPPWK